MDKSTIRTYEAIIRNEKIGIFGDYDVDGATSTALLGNYFSDLDLILKFIFQIDKKRDMDQIMKVFNTL